MVGRLALAAFVAGVTAVHMQSRLLGVAPLWGIGLCMVVSGGLAIVAARACVARAAVATSARQKWSRAVMTLVVMLTAALLGVGYASLRAQGRLDDGLACALRGHVTRLNIRVIGLPTGDGQVRKFDVEVLGAQAAPGLTGSPMQMLVKPPEGVPSRMRLTWRAPFGKPGTVPDILPGQVWRMALKLRRPYAALNPDSMDWEGRLFAQGVRALGAVQGRPVLLADQPWASPMIAGERLRYRLRARLMQVLKGLRSAPLILALALGDQSGIDGQDWQVFNRAGITHLVAISGLHVGLVAGLAACAAGWVFRRMRWRGRWATQRLPAQIVMAVAGLLAALVYCALAGWGIPARRVLMMLVTGAGCIVLRQPQCVSRTLLLAAGLVTLMDPWAPVAMGFWLSFAAVGALMMIAAAATGSASEAGAALSEPSDRFKRAERPGAVVVAAAVLHALYRLLGVRRPLSAEPTSDDLLFEEAVEPSPLQRWRVWMARWRVRLRAAARLQGLLTLALVPLLAAGVGQISLVSPVANAVAIPVVGLLVTPLALVCVLLSALPFTASWARHVSEIADALFGVVLGFVQWLAGFPWAVWHVASAPWWLAGLGCLGVAWALMPPGAPGRMLGWTLLLPVLIWRPAQIPPGAWTLVALDVGQAGAAVVLTQHHVVVFDVGLRFDNGDDAGMRVVGPYLRSIGRDHVDRLVVSHQHLDHMGGVRGLLAHVSIQQAFAPFDLNSHLAQESRTYHHGVAPRGWPLLLSPCEAGMHWSDDGVRFRFVHPPPGSHYTQAQANASSCVLVIEGAFHSAVLPGDIEAAQERAIVSGGDIGHVDLVLAAHHGSSTSSIPAWVAQLAPSHVIAQAGYNSRFGHPTPAVAQRWIESGAWFWRNDLDGAVVATSRAHGLAVKSVRDQRQRYWHEPLTREGYEACSTAGPSSANAHIR